MLKLKNLEKINLALNNLRTKVLEYLIPKWLMFWKTPSVPYDTELKSVLLCELRSANI